MRLARSTCLATLLLCMFVAVNSPAQEAREGTGPAAPNLASLQANWWTYFEGPRKEVAPRISTFLDGVDAQIPKLEPQNREAAHSVLQALRDNFSAYLDLLDETAFKPQQLPDPAVNYTIDELLSLAAKARAASDAAGTEELEVEREKRTFDGASRRRDAAFKDYAAAGSGDQRWLLALRLIQARSAQAISARRLDLLTQSYEAATAYAEASAARVDLAMDRLASSADEAKLQELKKRVASSRGAVDKAREKLRDAQNAAHSLGLETPQGRSQQRLQQQSLIAADVDLAMAEATLAHDEMLRWWTELTLNAAPDTDELEDQALEWSKLIRQIEQQAPDWKRQTENELLAVQGMSRDGLDRASRRLLDQRLGTAQETLARLGELDSTVADLKLLTQVVDKATAQYTGAFRSWLAGASRMVRAASQRVADLAEVPLFHIGDTPVTGGKILRFVIILAVGLLLSRGIRHAIRRVGDTESAGTQASLYTVSRLTHYTIIILSVFIALSSIGLDFRSLAIVAGALSVGIGFGLQSIVNNFVSGLIILFERSLRVGDFIELDTGLTGTVKAINVRSTLINTNDNIDIVVPNSEFVSTRLTNWTLNERILRVRISFGVAYGSDKELVKKAALEAAAEVPYTLAHMKGREPDVWLVEFGDSSLNFLLLVWVNRQGARRPTRTRAAYLWAMEDKFREYGIEIPFPQRDLHLRSGWAENEPEDEATS
ncbi:MAG: mechanosensitive ion channel domain-containing protein [Woeseiaceae bacterium]